jgi:hypothetical protein
MTTGSRHDGRPVRRDRRVRHPRAGGRRRRGRPQGRVHADGRLHPAPRRGDGRRPRAPADQPRLRGAGMGLFGAAAGYFLQWYSAAVFYPLNIGGRPLHDWPTYVVITFEVTVLLAAFTAGLFMLAATACRAPTTPSSTRRASNARPATATTSASSRRPALRRDREVTRFPRGHGARQPCTGWRDETRRATRRAAMPETRRRRVRLASPPSSRSSSSSRAAAATWSISRTYARCRAPSSSPTAPACARRWRGPCRAATVRSIRCSSRARARTASSRSSPSR